MALNIPKREIPAIAKIRRLPDEAAEQLIHALSTAPLEANADDMTARIAEQVDKIAIDDLPTIVDTIYTLYRVREFTGVSTEKFIADLVETLKDSDNPQLTVGAQDVPRVKDRFKRLLSIDQLDTVSKASGLQRDGERLYCDARIISDIRPVFKTDVMSAPLGAVITHTLKLGYHEGRSHDEFYVVLDREDLKALREAIERAEVKDATLRELIKKSGLSILGI